MIKLLFKKANEFFIITIDNKVIKYWDRKMGEIWHTSLQFLPPDPQVAIQINNSRNRIPANYINLLKVSKGEMEEFENAKDDNELKQIVLKDCKNNKCELVKEEIK